MKFIYPAVFRKNEEGRYKAFFPDLACCEAEGDTLDDAIDNANEAAYNWIYAEVMEDEMDFFISEQIEFLLNLALNVFSTAGTQDIDQTGLVDIAVDDLGAQLYC